MHAVKLQIYKLATERNYIIHSAANVEAELVGSELFTAISSCILIHITYLWSYGLKSVDLTYLVHRILPRLA